MVDKERRKVAYIVHDGHLDRLEEKLNQVLEQNYDRELLYMKYQDVSFGQASVLLVYEVWGEDK